MIDPLSYPLTAIFLVSLVLISGAIEIGRWIGHGTEARVGGNVTMLASAVLGLLALMISFTFSVALSRYEARREAVLEEANSITTTALRARLLPPPAAAESLRLLHQYALIRLDITTKAPTAADMDDFIRRSNQIQEALWQQAKAVAAKDASVVPTGVFIQSLNEMIDNQERRLTASRSYVPDVVVLALYGIAILAAGFVGYSEWSDGPPSRAPVYLVGFIVAAVILLIQDLDRPSAGFISVSQQPMIDAVNSLATYE